MTDQSTRSSAALLLRLSLGATWLSHALLTLVALGVPAFGASLAAQGMPTALSWPVALLELVGGLLMMFGLLGRVAALALLSLLAGALLADGGEGRVYAMFVAGMSLAYVLAGGATGWRATSRRAAACT